MTTPMVSRMTMNPRNPSPQAPRAVGGGGVPQATPQAPSGVTPVPNVPPPTSAPPGAPVSSFGPSNDLLSTQINPNTGGPNRTQLAENSIADWETQHAPQFAADQRSIGQSAAKFGRIGAGMTTNDLTGLESTHNRDRLSFRNALASNLAGDTINDQRSNNNELRMERDYQTGRSDKAMNDAERQRMMEEDLLDRSFGRSSERARMGYGGSPVDTLSGFSGRLGDQAGQSVGAGMDLLRSRKAPQTFGGMLPGTPDAQGVPQVTRGGVPITLADLLKGGRTV